MNVCQLDILIFQVPRGKFEEHSSVNLDSREFVLTITE